MSCGMAVGTCRRAARWQGPGTAAPLPPEPGSCRHAPRRQGLNAVGYDDGSLPRGVRRQMYIS
jgi:hypothetical protein